MWIRPRETERFRLRKGDILVSEGGDAGRTAIFDIDSEFFFQNAISRVRPDWRTKVEPRFIYYWFTYLKVVGYVEMVCNVATIPHFTAEKVKAAPFAFPPRDTQQRIARFLDEKTARIDGLIEKKRGLLDRLDEKRQALITKVVTKGLNPEVQMKSSGIDRLGDVPAHWSVRRIKELGNLIGGSGFPHDFQGQKDLELPFFKVVDLGRVSQGQKMLEADNSIDRTTASLLGAAIIEPGDIAFAKVGAALLLNRFRSIGVPCCIDNNMMAFRSDHQVAPDFALFAFGQMDFADIVQPGAIPSVSGGQVGEVEIVVPHIEEQIEIAQHLFRWLEVFEYCECRISESQRLLEEYRSALISEAVTGQLAELL